MVISVTLGQHGQSDLVQTNMAQNFGGQKISFLISGSSIWRKDHIKDLQLNAPTKCKFCAAEIISGLDEPRLKDV